MLKSFSNLKVCLFGERSIASQIFNFRHQLTEKISHYTNYVVAKEGTFPILCSFFTVFIQSACIDNAYFRRGSLFLQTNYKPLVPASVFVT